MADTRETIISAPPSTDLWRKPPTTDVDTAPAVLEKPISLSTFTSARVTFGAKWEHRYDQGGLVLRLTKPGAKEKWVKTGVEFYQGKPYISTVGCDAWADWSIVPTKGDERDYTLEVVREGDELGTSLWVYRLIFGGDGKEIERIPLREVTWFFADEEGWSIAVGPFAARPADAGVTEGKELQVRFWDFDVKQT